MSSWRRTYWSIWSANLITAIGMMSFLPFFPSLLEEMGLSDPGKIATWSGVVFGAAPLSATVMSPIWGALGDRIGRKLMVLRAICAIALFVGMMGFATSPWQLFLLRIGQGLFSGFIPPSITLVSIGAPPEKQGRVSGDLTTALALGAIVGPMLGGFVATVAGHRNVFFLVGTLALISAALVAFLAEEDPSLRRAREGDEAQKGMRGLAAGLSSDVRDVWNNASVRGMVLLVFCLQLGLGGTNPVLELHVRDLLTDGGASSASWLSKLAFLPGVRDSHGTLALATSLLFAGMAVSNLLLLPLWGRYGDSAGHRRALFLCGVGSALALFIQASATTYGLLFSGRMLMGAAMAGTGPLAFGMAASEVAIDRRGGAFGVVFSARTLAVALGGMAGGWLSSRIGVRGVMACSGAIVLLALFMFVRARRGGSERLSVAPR